MAVLLENFVAASRRMEEKERAEDKEGETSVTSEREGGERDRDVETDG